MGNSKDECRRRISLLKRLRVILLVTAAVLAVCAAAVAWLGRAPDDSKLTPTTVPQTVLPTIQLPIDPVSTMPLETIDQSDEQNNNPTQSDEDDAEDSSQNEFEDETEPQETSDIITQANDSIIRETITSSGGSHPDNTEPAKKKEPVAAHESEKQDSPMVLKLLLLIQAVDLLVIIAVSLWICRLEREYKKLSREVHSESSVTIPVTVDQNNGPQVGMLHNIGARPYQEDSIGTGTLEDGILAVVADGMGGLSGGDKVSQLIVRTMLDLSSKLRPGQFDGVLEQMLARVNQDVNQMLGTDGIYKSGSTLLAVLLRNGRFHWLTVGDSRIYLYHDGYLTQLNQEHNRGQEQILRAVRGEISFPEARATSKKSNVTSFLGMGKLKYVEKSVRSIPLAPGDRVLLMTDGVFNALTDKGIASVLAENPDVQAAADMLERLVVNHGNSKQDNFSAIILGLDTPSSHRGAQ